MLRLIRACPALDTLVLENRVSGALTLPATIRRFVGTMLPRLTPSSSRPEYLSLVSGAPGGYEDCRTVIKHLYLHVNIVVNGIFSFTQEYDSSSLQTLTIDVGRCGHVAGGWRPYLASGVPALSEVTLRCWVGPGRPGPWLGDLVRSVPSSVETLKVAIEFRAANYEASMQHFIAALAIIASPLAHNWPDSRLQRLRLELAYEYERTVGEAEARMRSLLPADVFARIEAVCESRGVALSFGVGRPGEATGL